MENLNDYIWILTELVGSLRENVTISARGSYQTKKHKSSFDEGCTKLSDQRK
jgi:hypothetical protein